MKKIIMSLFIAAVLSGCQTPEVGSCATSLNGTCLGRYDASMNIIPVGGVDVRYAGTECSGGGVDARVCSGTVKTKVYSWE